jgi:hypothetical protein
VVVVVVVRMGYMCVCVFMVGLLLIFNDKIKSIRYIIAKLLITLNPTLLSNNFLP